MSRTCVKPAPAALAAWLAAVGIAATGTCVTVARGQVKGAPKIQAVTKASKTQYKKRVRDQITAIAVGNERRAAKHCQKYLAQYPVDLELLYVLAIAKARMGLTDEAMQCVRNALKRGLPFERFLAGPRSLLGPLYRIPAFKELRRKHKGQLVHGPTLGSVTDTSARFWVRTASEVPVTIRVAPKGLKAPIRSGKAKTSKAADYTAVIEVTGLIADTKYSYVLTINGSAVAGDTRPTFRTFVPPGRKCRFAVGFGGGAGYTPRHERMWNTILTRRPRALLMLGDNVYIDTPRVRQTQRYCYYRRQSRPEYRALAASTPIYAIWDDHDFATNDCLGSPETDRPAWKPAVMEVFKQNFVNPYYGGGPKQPGCWFDFTIGDVDFFMLDCRYYRTRAKGRRATMLGPAQKKWLKAKLIASKGTFKVIASSVPWAKGTKPGSNDTWDGFPEEREEIFSFLEDSRIDGVVLLSADRHRSEAWKIQRPNGYALYDLESSRLTNVHTHGLIEGALFAYNKKCSFGLLEFDTTKADPELTYSIVNIDNEVIHTLKLTRSRLSHKRGAGKGNRDE